MTRHHWTATAIRKIEADGHKPARAGRRSIRGRHFADVELPTAFVDHQTAAAIDVASAAVVAAEAQQQNAQIQYALIRQGVTQQDTPGRVAVWVAPADSTISVPNWYFQQSEQLAAIQAELDAALSALDIEQANLQNELKKASNADFVSAEKRLAQAQVAYQIANLTDTQALSATENSDLQNASQALLDSATDELKAAQSAYDGMLTSTAAQSVLEARARVAAAQARLDNAQDRLNTLQTGSESLQLEAAQVGLDQAKAGVEQARSGKAQAEAALGMVTNNVERSFFNINTPDDLAEAQEIFAETLRAYGRRG